MPSKIHHQTITRQAFKSTGIAASEKLIDDYSSYPDFFHSRYQEVSPYVFIADGIEFHYPPHTPVDEFYRYWNHTPQRGTFMVSTAANRNCSFSEAGFKFYLDNILQHLRSSGNDEAEKFLGCLLHYLEDSTFGIHALEGPDGTDIYTIDRMSGRDFAKYICSIPLDEKYSGITVIPEIFATVPAEFPALLYRRYSDATATSRRALFDTALEFLTGKSQNSIFENHKIMFRSSVQLAADTIATIHALANGTAPAVNKRKLTDFAPCHYPIGGGGGFQLKRYSENGNKITFGVNLEARLLYHLPADVYSKFRAVISGRSIAGAELDIINDGEKVDTLALAGDRDIEYILPAPRNSFGFIVRAKSGTGSITISDGELAC